MNRNVRTVSKFINKLKNLEKLDLSHNTIEIIPSEIGDLIKLKELIIRGTVIKKLPKEIGKLKGLLFLNISGNPIEDIPDEIKYLDPINGGSLLNIALKKDDLDNKVYDKLKKLLPSIFKLKK